MNNYERIKILIKRQIILYKDCVVALERRQARGLEVTKDLEFFNKRLQKLRKEYKRG